MATPTLTHHSLPGALGEILVDVRAGSRGVPQPAVMLVHGFKGFKDYAFLPVFAERLARAGFVAVTASVSGSGVDAAGDFTRTERFTRNTYTRELDDLGLIMRALRAGELGTAAPTSVGVVGHSRGGGMALLLAHETPGIAAVVTWAAIGNVRRHSDAELAVWKRLGKIPIAHQRLPIKLTLDYEVVEDCLLHEHTRFSIAAAARSLGRPWLQVHGTTDTTVAYDEAMALAQLAGQGHELVTIPGGDHTWGTKHPWGGPTADVEAVFDATARFLAKHLS